MKKEVDWIEIPLEITILIRFDEFNIKRRREKKDKLTWYFFIKEERQQRFNTN